MVNKRQQKINEFCGLGNLERYRNELEGIFDLIEAHGCKISARTDEHSSQHVYDSIGGCHIRISLQEQYKAPVDILWTILHEFGHHLSGKSSTSKHTKEQKLKREVLAWYYAEKLLGEFPRLSDMKPAFIAYKDECLDSYNKGFTGD